MIHINIFTGASENSDSLRRFIFAILQWQFMITLKVSPEVIVLDESLMCPPDDAQVRIVISADNASEWGNHNDWKPRVALIVTLVSKALTTNNWVPSVKVFLQVRMSYEFQS